MPFTLGVTIFLSGKFHFIHRKSGRKYHVKPPQILLRKGEFGSVDFCLPDHTLISTLSLNFSVDLLEMISNSAYENSVTHFFQDMTHSDILILEKHHPRPICLAQYLQSVSQASNELDLINIEGQALSLLSSLFRLPPDQEEAKYYREIRGAISVLESHCNEKITIPKLARQVGINECYLKRYFRKYTGLTISAFLRKYRMELALMLFSQGKTAHEVSCETGYDNIYYFRNVFKKHFGYFPES